MASKVRGGSQVLSHGHLEIGSRDNYPGIISPALQFDLDSKKVTGVKGGSKHRLCQYGLNTTLLTIEHDAGLLGYHLLPKPLLEP